MDMAVANLFKHKALFQMVCNRLIDDVQPDYRRFRREYIFKPIEILRSVGVTDINELCLKCLEPFMLHIISQLAVEETESIDYITIHTGLYEVGHFTIDPDDDSYYIYSISLDNPGFGLEEFSLDSDKEIYPINERLFDKPFFITVCLFHF